MSSGGKKPSLLALPGVGVYICLTSLTSERPVYLHRCAFLSSMLAHRSGLVFAASAQPRCRLAGQAALQLAAMAKTAVWCTLVPMALRCVIVDDNCDFLRAAGELLDREGISVVGSVATGDEACRVFDELKPDIVLIDIGLGDETGIEVARRLAGQQQGTEQVCMILTSAYSEDDFADMIADSPVVSFLPKAALSGPAIRDIVNRARGSAACGPQRDSR